jgi:ArsR family transcriptional regulator
VRSEVCRITYRTLRGPLALALVLPVVLCLAHFATRRLLRLDAYGHGSVPDNIYTTSFMVAYPRTACYIRPMNLDTAAKRLAELGNTTRLQIFRLLVQSGREGLSIGEIQEHLGAPASTLAFHLRGLVVAGLVEQERQGRVVRCRPNIAALNDTLAFVKENCCAGFAADKRERRRGSAA